MHCSKTILLVIVLLFSVLCGKSYKISTVNWAGWSFLDVAEVKGYWKELGVDVEVVHFEDGAIMHDKMLTGEIDFSMNMMPYTVWMNNKVSPVSVIMETNWSHGGDKLVVRNPEEFNKGQGKKLIGVYLQGYALEYFLHSYFESIGLSLSDYTLVKMQPAELVKQFNAGRIPAVVIFEPLASKVVDVGKGSVLATTADFEGVIREGVYTFQDRINTYPKEDVVNILRGIIRALLWIEVKENRKEFYTILNEKTFFNEKTPYSNEQLEGMLSEVRQHTTYKKLEVENFKELTAYYTKLLSFLEAQKWIKKGSKAESFLFLKYLQEALDLEQSE